MSTSQYSKAELKNLSNLDRYIQKIKPRDPDLHDSLKTVGRTLRGLIDETYPRNPDTLWEARLHLAGPAIQTETNSLPYYLHVRMPIDGNWSFEVINITKIITSVQVAPTSQALILDILVSTSHGTGAFKSIFKSGNANKINVPVGIKIVNSVNLAISDLSSDDLLRLDVIQTDPSCAGIEIHLSGNYVTSEKV